MTQPCDFFDLLQVALGRKTGLTRTLTQEEWQALWQTCKKQGLLGIAYVACCLLPAEQRPERRMLALWAGVAQQTAAANAQLTATCAVLCQKLGQRGFKTCVLKGQANLSNYPEALRPYRTPGDIDLWMGGKSRQEVIDFVRDSCRRKNPPREPELLYHHIDWSYKGVQVEVHFRLSWMSDPWANHRLQRWSEANAQWDRRQYEGFGVPTVAFDAVYQLVHIFRHLFNEGIGLRQLLDYRCVLVACVDGEEPWSREATMQTLASFGLRDFAGAVMYVLQTVFGLEDRYLLCPPREADGRFLLDEIMMAGNFGQYDPRNVVRSDENLAQRFVRRQRRFWRFVSKYPREVIWGPAFAVGQRVWRIKTLPALPHREGDF